MSEPNLSLTTVWCEAGADWLDAAVLDGWRPAGERPRNHRGDMVFQHTFHVTFGAGQLDVDADSEVLEALWPRRYSYYGSESVAQQRGRNEALAKIRERATGSTRMQLVEEVEREITDGLARAQRHHDRWKELNELPQLFIAV